VENNSNYYFAQQKFYAALDENQLLIKIQDCQEIISNLEKSRAWKVIVKDCREKAKFIDDNWQDITDETTLNNMRVKKSAIKYILDLSNNYQDDLDFAQRELEKRRNPDKEISMDYDTEGI
jgi:hypothetical protein